MKKLVYSFPVILVLSIIISSCGKGMYIAKRKYTKGYYVNHSPKKPHEKKSNTATLTKTNVRITEALTQNHPGILENKEKEPVLTAEAQKTKINTASPASSKKTVSTVLKNKTPQIKLLHALVPNKKLTRVLQNKMAHDTSGALSLLWVVILVILLIYLIALLFDAFGLGWFIHILALIALILLVLWLLRVV